MSFTMTGSLSLYPRLTDGPVVWSDAINAQLSLDNGTGDGQANAYWSSTLSIAATDDETLNLQSLAYTAFGDSGVVSLAVVKTLVIQNTSSVTDITVEPGESDGWAKINGAVTVGASGVMIVHVPANGLEITGSSRNIKISNTDTVTTLTGDTTSGQKAVTGLSSTTGLEVGMLVSGTGIPSGAKVASITNSTSLMLTANATATSGSGGVSLDFQRAAATVKVYVVGLLD